MIVDRLRENAKRAECPIDALAMSDAADEIERLSALCRSAGLSTKPPETWNETHGWDEHG